VRGTCGLSVGGAAGRTAAVTTNPVPQNRHTPGAHDWCGVVACCEGGSWQPSGHHRESMAPWAPQASSKSSATTRVTCPLCPGAAAPAASGNYRRPTHPRSHSRHDHGLRPGWFHSRTAPFLRADTASTTVGSMDLPHGVAGQGGIRSESRSRRRNQRLRRPVRRRRRDELVAAVRKAAFEVRLQRECAAADKP